MCLCEALDKLGCLAQAYTRGLYIEDKIDLLMGYLVVNPLASLVGKVLGYKAKQKTKKYSPLTSSNQHSGVADLSRGEGEHTLEAARRAGLEHPNAKVHAVILPANQNSCESASHLLVDAHAEGLLSRGLMLNAAGGKAHHTAETHA